MASFALLQRCKMTGKQKQQNSTFYENKIQINTSTIKLAISATIRLDGRFLGHFPNMLYRIRLLEMFSTLFLLDNRDPINGI